MVEPPTATFGMLADALGVVDVARVAEAYLMPAAMDSRSIAQSGYYELYPRIVNLYAGLLGACTADDDGLIAAILSRAIDRGLLLDNTMYMACREGNMPVLRRMIEYGAGDWDDSFRVACEAGHREIALFVFEHWQEAAGECALSSASRAACKRNAAVVTAMFERGLTWCEGCGLPQGAHPK